MLYTPTVVHDPENTGDKPFDAVLIELKGGAAGAHKAGAKKAPAEESTKQ